MSGHGALSRPSIVEELAKLPFGDAQLTAEPEGVEITGRDPAADRLLVDLAAAGDLLDG